MEKLLRMQLERVEMGRNLEKQIGLLLRDVGAAQAQAFSQLQAYIATMQSLGLTPKTPEKVMIGGMSAQIGVSTEDPLAIFAHLDADDIALLLRLEHKISTGSAERS